MLMGCGGGQSSAVLRKHYEKLLYPYDVFMSGAMTGDMQEGNEVRNLFRFQNRFALSVDQSHLL